MSTDIEQVNQALVQFSAVEAGLQALRTQYEGVVYDVTSADGMAQAKAARVAVREPRYEVERIRKAAKAPLLAIGKKLDADAARITAALEKLEAPIDGMIKAEEARKEAERQAKIKAEAERVQRIHARIAELRGNATLTAASGSVLIGEHIADLSALAVDETFAEFREQAQDAKAAGLARLRGLHAAAVVHEAEQDRIAKERAELARLRHEQEARAERERLERLERERVERAAREQADREAAERARQEREAFAAEQAKARAAQQAEAQRLAAERAAVDQARREQEAERQRLDAERARIAQEQTAAEAAARNSTSPCDEERGPGGADVTASPGIAVSADQTRPSDAEIIEALALHFRVHEMVVIGWLCDMDLTAASERAAREFAA